MEKIITNIGNIYIDNTSENEIVLHDSEMKELATFDKLIEKDIRNKLVEIKTLKDILKLSFCKNVSYNPTFYTENGSDQFILGDKKIYIHW
jgi:hypothetical protein